MLDLEEGHDLLRERIKILLEGELDNATLREEDFTILCRPVVLIQVALHVTRKIVSRKEVTNIVEAYILPLKSDCGAKGGEDLL